VGPLALVVVSAGGWLLAGAALRPVERMRREADAISVSELDHRLPVSPADDELARLGRTLNSMLDRLEESYRSQARFVDQASHELRTPLGVLKAELDLALARSRTREELEAALRNASSETDRLVRLAEDLLVLARASEGRLPVRRMPVSVRTLLTQVGTAYEARAASLGRTITVTGDDDPVQLDPSRVRQAVESLLDNALRHGGGDVDLASNMTDPNAGASRGEETHGVRETKGTHRGADVRIEVRDHGHGFPETVLARPPEPFHRPANASPAGGGDGAGLGLVIVQAIARAHGGDLQLENDPRGGARAILTLRSATVADGGLDAVEAIG
jgi:signal transduction histidine kinase